MSSLERALADFDAEAARESTWANLSAGILFAGLLGALLTWLGVLGWPTSRVLLGTGLALIPLVWMRRRWSLRRVRAQYLVDWYERAAARLEGTWDFGQSDGSAALDRSHPFAADLDVVGPDSLFHRVNACHTVLGEDSLAARLTEFRTEAPGDSGPDRREIQERQEAVQELLERNDARELLEVELRALSESGARHSPEVLAARTRALARWGLEPVAAASSAGERALEVLLPLSALAGLFISIALERSWAFTLVPAAINVLYARRFKDLEALTSRFEAVSSTLRSWSKVLEVLVRLDFESPLLRRLLAPVKGEGESAPQAVAALRRLAHRLAQRKNAYWALTGNIVLLSDVRARRGLLEWHRTHGPHLQAWMGTVAELEAHLALTSYAAALPTATWPVVSEEGPLLVARDLAHALLPAATRVPNDVTLSDAGELLIVTGSNMSGKSTYIRSVGLAVVATRAGLPVPATSFRMRPMGVVSSMRVEDSLSDGLSRFHAEVRRLKFCLDTARTQGRMLVLLDEILSGTNSRERHAGTEAVLRQLANGDTLTLVSTHDLCLAGLADEPGLHARVVHFTDEVEDGLMTFDYRLREGVLPSTNALEVMRLEGLLAEDLST